MKAFADLFTALDLTTKTSVKVVALRAYFETADPADKLWTIALFSVRRPKRAVTPTQLRAWVADAAGIPYWLFEEAYPIVGDLAETTALVLPEGRPSTNRPLHEWIAFVQGLKPLEEDARKAAVLDAWAQLDTVERFLFNKLLTGGFRIGVSQRLMTRVLAQATGQDEAGLTHKLMGDWTPDKISYDALVLSDDPTSDQSKPDPFYLAYPLEMNPADLGPPRDWRAEWKWDGIRGQLILRGGAQYLWSRGEDLMTDRFPELSRALDFLPDGTVLDGEVLAWDHAAHRPLAFAQLQKRIGRKTVPKTVLAKAPVVIRAYDLLEDRGTDIRPLPFAERRARMARYIDALPPDAPLILSDWIDFDDWSQLAALRDTARDYAAEGLMLERADAPYLSGRKNGDWWKWKVDPLVIDAVMIYAQSGHGRRANLFSDFTLAVWNGPDLVPFTKAYSGLTDAEFRQITAWVKQNTQQRFGPVRQVTPHHVFEIAFERIQESPRHKSGVALRFPRMHRWRQDKPN